MAKIKNNNSPIIFLHFGIFIFWISYICDNRLCEVLIWDLIILWILLYLWYKIEKKYLSRLHCALKSLFLKVSKLYFETHQLWQYLKQSFYNIKFCILKKSYFWISCIWDNRFSWYACRFSSFTWVMLIIADKSKKYLSRFVLWVWFTKYLQVRIRTSQRYYYYYQNQCACNENENYYFLEFPWFWSRNACITGWEGSTGQQARSSNLENAVFLSCSGGVGHPVL